MLLLAVGVVACGSSDDSSSTSTEAAPQAQANGESNGGASDDSASADGEAAEGSGSSSEGSFTPKQHNDSGGGSQQFRSKGGDNSVQDFGEEADTSERDAAAEALHNFLDARAEGDWAAACDYMSKGVIEPLERLATQARQIEDKSCGGVLEKLTNPAAKQEMKAEAEQADVGSLRMEGDRAFIIYTGAEGAILAMPMADEGGAWKVASLAGTPLN